MTTLTRLILTSALLFLVGCGTSSELRQDRQPVVLRAKNKVPALPPETLMKTGQKAYQTKDYQKAFDYYLTAAGKLGETPKAVEANYWALRCASKLNRHPETVELSDIILRHKALTEGQLVEVRQHRLRGLESQGFYYDAVLEIQTMSTLPGLAKEQESLRLKSQELLQARLTKPELEAFVAGSFQENLKAVAYYRLAELSLEERDNDRARAFLSKAISAAPQSEAGRRANDLLLQLDAVRRVEPKTIGLVVPLSGKQYQLGQRILRSVQMGLGLYGQNQTSFRLAVIDSEGNPDGARRGVEELVKEDSVVAIIGSVLSKTAPAVAAKANELGVPSIGLSQKSGVTEMGPLVFRNALTSEMQVRALVKSAMEDLGLRRFAILFPNDSYGIEYANLFWDEVLARGGTIRGAQSYPPKETDFRQQIERLVGTYFVEARSDEYKYLLKDWSDQQTQRSARNAPPLDLLPPVVDFDAIFIADGSKSLGQISGMLSSNSVRGIPLLGTNLWSNPETGRRAGNFANQVYFVDSFASSDAFFSQSAFVRDYRNEFGEDPSGPDIQAFDAALILRQLISTGATSRETLSRALAEMNNLPGSLGPMSMTEDREVERPVRLLRLEAGVPVPYTKAPIQ